jgi:hypothetical protein
VFRQCWTYPQAHPIFSNEVSAAGCFAVSCHNYERNKVLPVCSVRSDHGGLVSPNQIGDQEELARSQRWPFNQWVGKREFMKFTILSLDLPQAIRLHVPGRLPSLFTSSVTIPMTHFILCRAIRNNSHPTHRSPRRIESPYNEPPHHEFPQDH